MGRDESPSYLGSRAFWSFVADQRSDAVLRRLQEHVSGVREQSPVGLLEGSGQGLL